MSESVEITLTKTEWTLVSTGPIDTVSLGSLEQTLYFFVGTTIPTSLTARFFTIPPWSGRGVHLDTGDFVWARASRDSQTQIVKLESVP